jgi:hypothetical protein
MSNKNNKIFDLISRILENYEKRGEISMLKIVFLIYLCDWKYSIEKGTQITDIKWKFLDKEFSKKIISAFNKGKIQKNTFSFKSDFSHLSNNEKKIIDFISTLSMELETDDFIKLVFSTYPMIRKEKDVHLDLPVLAKDYIKNYEYVK